MDSEPLPANDPSERRSARVERRRRRILDAAADCFGRHGFPKTTVEEIAGRAGVSKGLVYSYFESKDDLLDAVLERTLDEWISAAWEEVRREAHGAIEGLAVMQRASLEYARRTPVLRAMLQLDVRLLLVERRPVIDRAIENWRDRLVDLLERGVASGELRADLDLLNTVDVIRLLHMEFIDRLFIDGPIDPTDEGLLDAANALISRGIEQSTSSSGKEVS